jgi:hypothetical protein
MLSGAVVIMNHDQMALRHRVIGRQNGRLRSTDIYAIMCSFRFFFLTRKINKEGDFDRLIS